MKYKTLVELYLTFLTYNDSYMQKVPVGSELTIVNGDLCYKGKISIDNEVGFLYHKYIEEIDTCKVCGKEAKYFEPRFLYYACKEHENFPPAYM